MNRSRTYNPTISRRTMFPAPPAHVYAPAGGTQLLWDTSKPMANGQLQINNSQRPTPNPQFPMPRWTFTFSAKEKDSETGLSYFGSRYYNSDLSIWLSVDPMSDKYPSLSPYVYCADNPVKLVDPNGQWIPGLDDDNNIIVTQEKGDDINSFKKFMGPAYSDDEIQKMYGNLQEGKINLTTSYGGVFQLMTDAINDAKKDPFFVQNKNYNCWGASLALMREEKLYGEGLDSFLPWDSHGVGLNSPGLFDLALNNYTPVRQETASVGKTIMRFGAPCWGKTTHASIFLGVDNSGNEYTFSKNGWNLRPMVCESHGLVYKYVVGRTPFESGYYSK